MKTISRKLIRRDPAGYEVWRETALVEYDVEVIDDAGDPESTQEFVEELEDQSGRLMTLDVCYSPEGGYIGTEEDAEFLCKTLGIKPEVTPGNKASNTTTCSIGFCEREQKWYGWSHRTIHSFGIGDIAEEGDCVCSSGWTEEYLAEHPDEDLSLPVGFEAKTLEDAKRMAIAFADSVG